MSGKKSKTDKLSHGQMDHPEQYKTDKESLFDKFESEKHVDPIPMEDKNEEVQEEKDKDGIKHTSSSEKKFPGFFDKK